MSACRFLYPNHIPGPQAVSLSSARAGLVGMPAPRAAGSALAYAAGEHTGPLDQVFLVEIDSVQAGHQVGQATFRWRRADSESWEAGGVPTSESFVALADGVHIKWVSGGGGGDDLALGDSWSILAARSAGAVALLDRDRDSQWYATACAGQWLEVDLAEPRRVRAVVLADHNLSDTARVRLLAGDSPDWSAPACSLELEITRPHLVAFLDQSRRYWRLELNDPNNPEGLLRASQLFLGDYFEPSRGFRRGYTRGLVAGRALTATDTGKLAGSARSLGQRWRLAFALLNARDLAGFQEMYRQVHDAEQGRLEPIFFTPFPQQPADTLYCLPGAELSWRHLHQGGDGGRFALEMTLEEMLRSHA